MLIFVSAMIARSYSSCSLSTKVCHLPARAVGAFDAFCFCLPAMSACLSVAICHTLPSLSLPQVIRVSLIYAVYFDFYFLLFPSSLQLPLLRHLSPFPLSFPLPFHVTSSTLTPCFRSPLPQYCSTGPCKCNAMHGQAHGGEP